MWNRKFLPTVSLRFAFLSAFISLFIITITLMSLVSWFLFHDTLTYTALSAMKAASTTVMNEIAERLRPIYIETELTSRLLQNGVLSNDFEHLIPYTAFLTQKTPLIQDVYWSDNHGKIIRTKKAHDGSVTSYIYDLSAKTYQQTILYYDSQGHIIKKIQNNHSDNKSNLQEWYNMAKNTKQPIWSGIFRYVYYPNPLGTGTIAPIFNHQGKLIGEFGLALTLDYFSKFIQNLKIGKNGFSFILDGKGNLVAYPYNKFFLYPMAHTEAIINIKNTKIPLISTAYTFYQNTLNNTLSINFKNNKYFILFAPILAANANHWLVGVVVPENEFNGPIIRMYIITVMLSILFLLLSVFVILKLVKKIVRPIKLLVKQTEEIKHFELRPEKKITTQIEEAINLKEAFHNMRSGLKSFQKYVPQILVRQLIDSGQASKIGGEKKRLAILFTEIEHFMDVTEKMDSNALMKQLCEYFEVLSKIIIENKGTIDKYIGSSVMAFWGAPLPEKKPAKRAALAALQCQMTLIELNEKWRKEKKPEFITHFGIHLGDAIVGNVGSSYRLNYTALGDTINTASRLAELNRRYKTTILISEAMYQIIKDAFILRKIDKIILRGKKTMSNVYELISDKTDPISFDVEQYQYCFDKALHAFERKNFEEALYFFKQCLLIYPEDNIVPIFIKNITG